MDAKGTVDRRHREVLKETGHDCDKLRVAPQRAVSAKLKIVLLLRGEEIEKSRGAWRSVGDLHLVSIRLSFGVDGTTTRQ